MRPQPRARIFAGTIVPAGLSNVQLEAIALATDAHDDEEAMLAWALALLLCGDGTGCGKGRTIVGCILHNFHEGRRRSV